MSVLETRLIGGDTSDKNINILTVKRLRELADDIESGAISWFWVSEKFGRLDGIASTVHDYEITLQCIRRDIHE